MFFQKKCTINSCKYIRDRIGILASAHNVGLDDPIIKSFIVVESSYTGSEDILGFSKDVEDEYEPWISGSTGHPKSTD